MVEPLRRGTPITPAIWDVARDKPLVADPVPVPPCGIVLVDGIFLHRPGCDGLARGPVHSQRAARERALLRSARFESRSPVELPLRRRTEAVSSRSGSPGPCGLDLRKHGPDATAPAGSLRRTGLNRDVRWFARRTPRQTTAALCSLQRPPPTERQA